MTTALIEAPPRWRHFLRHGAEMVLAMVVGMVLLAPLWGAALGLTGLGGAPTRPDVAALVDATDMTVAMTVWMLYRGHGRARVVEMAAAMYVPYLVLLVPYWLGVLPGEHVMMGGHALMLPAMAVAMLAHRAEYSRRHGATATLPHGSTTTHPLIGVLGRRWATWLALAMSFDSWEEASVPAPWTLLLLPAAYLVIGGFRGRLRDGRMLALQLAGLVLYIVLAVVAASVEPATAAWVVAAGWGIHAVWDYAHHRADAVVPRGWSEWCGVVDLVIAVTIVLSLTSVA